MRNLTDLENRVLNFADTHPHLDKAAHDIRTEFGWRPPAYFLRLHQILDDPAALAARPQLVNRLTRIRNQKAEARASRTFQRVS